MSLQKFDNQEEELKISREKIAFLETSLQSTKDAISGLEKDLYASNAKLGWFKYKLEEAKCKLDATNLKALNLEKAVSGLNTKVEL